MKNMTMGNMTMENSHNMHMNNMMATDHGGHLSSLKHYFHFSAQAVVLFSGWNTMTWAEMLGSCIGIAILAMLYEGLKVLREYIDAKFRREVYFVSDPKKVGTDRSSRRIGMLRPEHFLQTLLHFIQLWISLSLMLVFMTFNVYLCLAVTVGGAVGYFCFAWIQRPGERYGADMCH